MRKVMQCLVGAVVSLAAMAGTGNGVAAAADAVFRVSPTSGGPGTVVDVRFKTVCPRPAGGGAATATVTLLRPGSAVIATTTAPVSRAGRWFAKLTVPATPAD